MGKVLRGARGGADVKAWRLRRCSGGAVVEGLAAAEYHPSRRSGAAHYADALSRSLWIAKKVRPFGETWAWRRNTDLSLRSAN